METNNAPLIFRHALQVVKVVAELSFRDNKLTPEINATLNAC